MKKKQAKKKKDGPSTIENIFKKNTKLAFDSPRAKLITQKITEMIALDIQPLSIVEDHGLKNLLAVTEERCQIPSRKTFVDKLIPEMYESKNNFHYLKF